MIKNNSQSGKILAIPQVTVKQVVHEACEMFDGYIYKTGKASGETTAFFTM